MMNSALSRSGILILLLLLALTSCNNAADQQATEKVVEPEKSFNDEIEEIIQASKEFFENRDLDGDGEADEIYFDYTGGAHCCYLMSLRLTSLDSVIDYPFEMDGGFSLGMPDGSDPDHFDIRDLDGDGRDEIFMEAYTYNGDKTPLEPEWVKEYGVHTNYLWFDFEDGEMKVKDWVMEEE